MHRCVVMTAVSALMLLPLSSGAQSNLNTSGVRIRLERADAMRGPETIGEDNYFNSYLVSSGNFRGFTANSCITQSWNCTHAIDGTAAWDVAGAVDHPDVLKTNGTSYPAWAFCGQWLNSTILYNNTLYGFAHGENPAATEKNPTNCSNYYDHHKTMTLWTSYTGTNAGLSWNNPLKIIDSTEGSSGHETGLGDCTAIADSTYAYLFCRRTLNTATVAARAPLTSLGQGSPMFTMYDNGWTGQPGIDGAASELSGQIQNTSNAETHPGSSISHWVDKNWAMFLNVEDMNFGGVKTSFTAMSNLQTSSIGFSTLPAPLFVQDPALNGGGYPYKDYPGVNLYIYPSALSLGDGSRNWNISTNGQFLLAYTFVPPSNKLSDRILAMRSVTVTSSGTAEDPQILVDLSTRFDSNLTQYYSSTQPLAIGPDYTQGSFATRYQDTVGYLVQAPPPPAQPISQGQTLTKIVECRNTTGWPGSGHVDHLVTSTACDSGYTEVNVAGYVYPNPPASGNGVELYRCSVPSSPSVAATHFVAATSNCDSKGNMEKPLGWALKN